MAHDIAILQWRDSDAIHVIDLLDGTETRHSHAWQESLNTILPGNNSLDYGSETHIFLSDDGIAHRADLDGMDNVIPYPAGLSFRPFAYREYPSMDLSVIGGYDDVNKVEKVAFVKTSTNYLIREKLAQEVYGSTSAVVNRMAWLHRSMGLAYGNRLVQVIGPVNGEAKLLTYDPFDDVQTMVNLTNASGDLAYGECWMLRVWANQLFVLPKVAYHSLQNPPVRNMFQFDTNFNAVSYLIPTFNSLSDSSFAGADAVAVTGVEDTENQYVVYQTGFDKLVGGAALVLDLDTKLTSVISQTAIPAEQLPTTLDQINVAETVGKFSHFHSVGVSWFGLWENAQGKRQPLAKVFVWDLTSGALMNTITYTLDSHGDAELEDLIVMRAMPFQISGTTRVKTVPVSTTVDMQDETSGIILARSTSDVDGYYTFRCYTPRNKTTIATHPRTKQRNGAVSLAPVPVMTGVQTVM